MRKAKEKDTLFMDALRALARAPWWFNGLLATASYFGGSYITRFPEALTGPVVASHASEIIATQIVVGAGYFCMYPLAFFSAVLAGIGSISTYLKRSLAGERKKQKADIQSTGFSHFDETTGQAIFSEEKGAEVIAPSPLQGPKSRD